MLSLTQVYSPSARPELRSALHCDEPYASLLWLLAYLAGPMPNALPQVVSPGTSSLLVSIYWSQHLLLLCSPCRSKVQSKQELI